MSAHFHAEVIQFKAPDGRQIPTSTKLPIALGALYKAMLDAKCHFEAEILPSGEVSVAISNGQYDLDGEIITNGPAVQEAMGRLLLRESWHGYPDPKNP